MSWKCQVPPALHERLLVVNSSQGTLRWSQPLCSLVLLMRNRRSNAHVRGSVQMVYIVIYP